MCTDAINTYLCKLATVDGHLDQPQYSKRAETHVLSDHLLCIPTVP